VLTSGGKEFVTPLSLAAISGNPVYEDIFSLKDETEMGHIRLAREADLLAVVPASADIIAKAAYGIANDLASTILLAAEVPVLFAPAMNSSMWRNKAVQRNVKQLKEDGVIFVEPGEGELACGETGVGRLQEVDVIFQAIDNICSKL
jgi:phosphopantothenoylcysteine decarboxylase/phosphopantothenate--cysteine ligase